MFGGNCCRCKRPSYSPSSSSKVHETRVVRHQPTSGMQNVMNALRKTPLESLSDGVFTPQDRRLVLEEYPRLMQEHADLFSKAWARCANQSQSIKLAFNLDWNTPVENNMAFMSLAPFILKFFNKIVYELKLEEPIFGDCCEALGARHLCYHKRGFSSTFWDFFLMCLIDAFSEGLDSYLEEKGRQDVKTAFEHFARYTIHHMRLGYARQRCVESKGGKAPPEDASIA